MSTEKTVNVAIAGASGAVGEALVEILQERKFPVGELALLASPRSEGKRVQFNGKSVQIQRLDAFDFSNTQIGLFSGRRFGVSGVRAEGGCSRLYRGGQHLALS
jgi:aspartate-semialdehyde dehydrogenase